MGIIRVLLALSVVISHSNPIFGIELVGGPVAVQSFYIISGFYMALILNEKYIKRSQYKLFISNRFLRIFPVYWVILFCTLLIGVLSGLYGNSFLALENILENFSDMDFSTQIIILFSNIALFGQDIFMFLGLDQLSGTFEFTENFREHPTPAFKYLFVPQAWTIGVELTFYLIAPFLVRLKLQNILLIMLGSFLLRVLFYANGYSYDPWSNRFFPLELFFFLAGSLSYRVYVIARTKNLINKGLPLLGLIIAYLLLYTYLPFPSALKAIILYSLIFISMPFIFLTLKSNKFDRYIGEYSYTIYLSHLLVSQLVEISGFHFLDLGTSVAIGSVLFSFLIITFISNPIEYYRQKRVKKSKMNNL